MPQVEQQRPPAVAPVAPVAAPQHLDRRAGAPAGVSGTIAGHDGQPLAGATVCAWDVDPNAGERGPRCVTTDGGGTYQLTGLVPSLHEIHASAAGHQPIGQLDRIALRSGEARGVDIRLAGGGVAVHGIVSDVAGRPIAGAQVYNRDEPVGEQGRRHSGAAAAQTDAEGRFTLWLSPGQHTLVASAEGFVTERLSGSAAPGRHALELDAEATLSGQVIEAATGAPVRGARVVAINSTTRQRGGVAYTDEDGRYALKRLPAGLYKPYAEAPGRTGLAAHTAHVLPGKQSSLPAIALRPALTVSGRLQVAGGSQTCSNGQVSLHSNEGHTLVELADPDGAVFFPAVPPGIYFIKPECPGAVAPQSWPELQVGPQPVPVQVWEFAAGRTIVGTIVDDQGLPLAGVDARARLLRGECGPDCARVPQLGGAQCQTDDQCAMDEVCDAGVCIFAGIGAQPGTGTVSDALGRFVITGLPPGHYMLSALLDGRTDARAVEVDVRERDAADVRVSGTRMGQLGGIVADARGQASVGTDVDIFADHGTYLSHKTSVSTDEDGRFTAFGLGFGDYRVRARARAAMVVFEPNLPQAGDVRARVDPGAPAEVRVKTPDPGLQIRGRVRGPDGAPVGGILVRARHQSSLDAFSPLRDQLQYGEAEDSSWTDANGEYTLRGLSEGRYAVWADRQDGAYVAIRGDIAVGSEVVFTLPAMLAMSGRLTGASPERFTIGVHDQADALVRIDTFEHTDGTWAMEGLPPGTYEVHCATETERAAAIVTLGERSLAGVELAMAAPGSVHGRIVDARAGAPLAGVKVKLAPAGQVFRFAPWSGEIVSDPDGRFVVDSVPPGPVTLSFPAYEPERLEATITSGQKTEVWPALRLAPLADER